MNCLTACENAVFNFYLGEGDQAKPIYMVAEDLSDNYKGEQVCAACVVLKDLGLLRQCGRGSSLLKISPATMGDVAKGYFRESGHQSVELLELEKRLLEMEIKHTSAVDKMELLEKSGGLAAGSKGKK